MSRHDGNTRPRRASRRGTTQAGRPRHALDDRHLVKVRTLTDEHGPGIRRAWLAKVKP